MRKIVCISLLVFASALIALPRPMRMARPVRTVYNLKKDWSDVQNPNGAWSYNQGATPISTHETFWWGQSGWGYLWIGDGCIIKGDYFEGITDPWGEVIGPAHDWKPGDVMMHALSIPYGGESTFVNVKWTSPADGVIDISGRAWDGEIFADRDVAWQLIVQGNIVAECASVIGLHRADRRAQFGSNAVRRNSLRNIPVKQGDVVEFRVITGTYYGHFVGIEETITLTSRQSEL